MNNNLQIFKHEQFGEIRTIEEDGKVLFCGNDCAKALGYKNPSRDVNRHCKHIQKRCTTDSVGRQQEMLFIPEGDLYRLITHSELPSAEKFERWVFDEVLPSIRKHGGYIAGQETLSDDELLARAVMVANSKIAERDKLIAEKDVQIQQMKPKEVFADAVATSQTSILIGELAKLLRQNGVEIGQNRLFAWLRENGYLIKRKGTDWNMPTQKSMELGLFEIKERTINNPDGTSYIKRTTKVTGKGQQYFINKFLAEKAS